MSLEDLSPWFLGAYGENAQVLEELVVDFLRDHVYWRRNLHPESEPPIAASAYYDERAVEFRTTLRKEMLRLSADLKRSVPFFSPRYMGHMASDLLLPGLIAKLVTTLYNPNNVSEEASPATLDKELEVGMQLARMVGYATDEGASPAAWGHLTSGGTVANYEGLRNLLAVKLYPLALAAGAQARGIELGGLEALGAASLGECTPWALANLSVEQAVALRDEALGHAERQLERQQLVGLVEAIEQARWEALGAVGFFAEHPELEVPLVLVPSSAHYSWEKAMKLLGLGTRQLVALRTDRNMRMDVGHLREVLEEALEARRPVRACVGVLGTTEFGTLDPLKEIVALREQMHRQGLFFGVHVDAAWGGYLHTVFRRPDGGLHSRDVLRKEFHYFPSQTVYDTFAAMAKADSVTIDPHKLGYLPYPAGAYVGRNRAVIDFVAHGAAYVFDVADQDRRTTTERLRHLGQYILEGSKPGSAAAAAYLTHRVLPLHSEGFGQILKQTIRSCEYFYDTVGEFAERVSDRVRVVVPFEPDSNLICLALNPVDNQALAPMNRFGRALFAGMRVDPKVPVQNRPFFGSYTSLLASRWPPEQAAGLLRELGVAPEDFQRVPTEEARQDDHIFLLRHTLMNPWLMFDEDGKNYIDRYLDFLEGLIDAELARGAWR